MVTSPEFGMRITSNQNLVQKPSAQQSAPESARLSARPSGSALGPRSAPSRRFLPGLWINLSDRKFNQWALYHVDQTTMLSNLSKFVRRSSMWSRFVKICQARQMSFFENCQTKSLSNVGKMMQDVTYCVHNNVTHYLQHRSAMFWSYQNIRLFKIVAFY